jgi:hypothetical protein
MFLRQIVEQLGESPDHWTALFDKAWDRFLQGSQVISVRTIEPRTRRRIGPWIIGLVVVAVGVTGVLYLAGRVQGRGEGKAPPTPATLLPLLAPTPAPPPVVTPPPEPTPSLDPGTLVVRTGTTSCWVQVRIVDQGMQSKLLAPHELWEVPAAGRQVEVVLGDAGAIEAIEYLGETRNQVGRSGEVVRLVLGRTVPATETAKP